MIKMSFGKEICALLLFALAVPMAAKAAATPAQAGCDRPARLRFSYFPQGQLLDNATILRPIFKELSDALHVPVESVSMSSYGAVMEGLLSGSVDIARLGPASYASVRKSDASITPFATLANKPDLYNADAPVTYYSMLIVRQKSDFTIASLKGKKLALVDPDSTSGALIPLNIFSKEIKTPLAGYFSRIGYSGSHEQSVHSLINKEVDAAFVASTSLAMLIQDGAIKQNDIRILWRSGGIPHDPFVYRGQLCADIREKIQKVFFDSKNPNMAAALQALHAEKFVPTSDADYQIIRDVQAF
ncbi:MAG TPA: phosphate/phosphite/phosphonate ABC transporter substrate-binding protein [Herbaspirillum sp.]|jgi:phosphonate transport system substrate-binding protein